MNDTTSTVAARDWFISSGRASLWLACGSFGVLFALAAPALAAPIGLFAAMLGGAALLGRCKKRGTSNPVMGFCGLVLGLLTGSLPLLLMPARMAVEANTGRSAVEQAPGTLADPGAASVSCADGTLTLHSPGDAWRLFPKGAGDFGATCDGHGIVVDPGNGSELLGLVISQPYDEANVRRNGLANMARIFMESFDGFESKANQSVTDSSIGGQPCSVCEMTGTMDGKPVRLRQILVHWRGHLFQIRMVGDDSASFSDHADRFADAIELVAAPAGGS